MTFLQRTPAQAGGRHAITPTTPPDDVSLPAERPTVPRTRAGAAWFGVCAAAATLVVLIVFMLQNTRSVEISFLWLHGSVPLALGLLVAAVGSAIAVMVIGTVRITQLRHRQHRQRATIQPHNEIQPRDDLGLDSHRTEGL